MPYHEVYWEKQKVAVIDDDTDLLLAVADEFQRIWNSFKEEGVRVFVPSEYTEEERKAGILKDAVGQSFALGDFLQRLEVTGFQIKAYKGQYDPNKDENIIEE